MSDEIQFCKARTAHQSLKVPVVQHLIATDCEERLCNLFGMGYSFHERDASCEYHNVQYST